MSQPPYLPPHRMPGAQQRRSARPLSMGGGPRWPLMAGTAIITAVLSLGLSFAFYSPQTVQLQLTAVAAATFTAEYTPPPTLTPIPPDADQDQVLDADDNCRTVANSEQSDFDEDTIGDACDDDRDGDDLPNADDNCPLTPGVSSVDSDGDGQGDACDADDDQDRLEDERDNCPVIANSDQSDMDGDDLGDVCDTTLDLQGIEITTTASQPLYIGQMESETPLRVAYSDDVEAVSEAKIQIMASEGTLRPEGQMCSTAAGSVLTLPVLPATIIYCPPAQPPAADLTITAREVDASNQTIGSGGYVVLQAEQEELTLVMDIGVPISNLPDVDPALFNRCTLSEPFDGLDLELDAIPLVFTLQTEPNTSTGRIYPVSISVPAGYIYWVDARTCQPMSTGTLTSDTVIPVTINQPSLFYYVPDASAVDTTLRVSIGDESLSYAIPPMMVAVSRINFRNNSGSLVTRITDGQRALIVGQGDDGWVQVKIDGDDRDLWVNLEQYPETYRLLGSLAGLPTVQTPNFP